MIADACWTWQIAISLKTATINNTKNEKPETQHREIVFFEIVRIVFETGKAQ